MSLPLGPHELYLVVRAKEGWAVNLGADQLDVFTNRHDAREAAARHVATARAAGRKAAWRDTSEEMPSSLA